MRDELIAQGTRNSLNGRASFRTLLGDLSQSTLPASDFSQVWKMVQQRLSKAFLNNGLRIVAELQQIAAKELSESAEPPELNILSQTVGGIIDELTKMHLEPVAMQKIASVLGEMLCNKTSSSFQWMSEIGAKYVVICALGLDPEVERRIRDRITSWILIPDTHVLLSYLCKGDEGHGTCKAILGQLHNFHCVIWAMDAVLEEVVNHAEIADASFWDWHERVRIKRKDFPGVVPVDLLQVEDNAFVKGFANSGVTDIRASDWREYIGEFRGIRHLDTNPLARIILDELGAKFVEDDDRIRSVGKAFMNRVLRPEEREINPATTMRWEWDGRLLASLTVHREAEPLNHRIIVMSDSDRLRHAFYRNVSEDKRRGIKISDPAAVACALSLVPGTSVNLECVAHFLFNRNVTLSGSLRADEALKDAFSHSPKWLRGTTVADRVDSFITGGDGSRSD